MGEKFGRLLKWSYGFLTTSFAKDVIHLTISILDKIVVGSAIIAIFQGKNEGIWWAVGSFSLAIFLIWIKNKLKK